MAYTLRHSCSCSRYLSPCRFGTPGGSAASPISNNSQQVAESTTSILTRSRNKTRNNLLSRDYNSKSVFSGDNLSHEQREKTPIFLSSQRKLSDTKNRTLGYVDISSVVRMVGALNIDIPQWFKLRKTFFRQKDGPAVVEDSKTEHLHQTQDKTNDIKKTTAWINKEKQYPDVYKTEGQSESKKHTHDTNDTVLTSFKSIEELQRELQSRLIERDTHDFERAMFEKDSTIKMYCAGEGALINMAAKSNDTSKGDPASKEQQSTLSEGDRPSSPVTKSATTNLVRQIANYLPGFSSDNVPKPQSKPVAKKKVNKDSLVPRSAVDRKTRGLVKALKAAASSASRLVRLEEFSRHLSTYPDSRAVAVKEKLIPCLLRLRLSKDVALREQAMEALALVGYADPVRGRGIRILALDGGGTRGLVAIEILRRLQESTKMEIHEMFDYVCGVSTGSLIGIMLAIHKLSLDEAEHLYKTFSREVFNRYKLMGVGKLVMSQGYYDAQLWEKILKENIGTSTFLESTRQPNTPKVIAVSTLMNMTKLSNFIFRNYNHPPGAQSQFPGSCKYAFWEAIRASSAAPGYYEEYKLDEWIHQDGGIITNNPTALAIHESKLLWPNNSLQFVVSIGTGRYEPSLEPEQTSSGLRNKVTKIIQSATDTEAVHTTLHDLLPPSTYVRFNPYMSEEYFLDEIRPDRWEQMTIDTQLYCRKNQHKIDKASQQLVQPKHRHQKAHDWLKLKMNELA